MASFVAEPSQVQPNGGGQLPRLHISVNDIDFNYFANGKDGADISVCFQSSDGTAAPRDINIWFTLTGGKLDHNPLQIKKGSFYADDVLTSAWPENIHTRFVSSNPKYDAEGATEFDAHFIPRGVMLVAPEKLSVVDNVPLRIVFFDERGNAIAPGEDREVTLQSTQSKLRFAPAGGSCR